MASKQKQRKKKAAAKTREAAAKNTLPNSTPSQQTLDSVLQGMKAAVRLFGVLSIEDWLQWFRLVQKRPLKSYEWKDVTSAIQWLREQSQVPVSAADLPLDFGPVAFIQLPMTNSGKTIDAIAHQALPHPVFTSSAYAQNTQFELNPHIPPSSLAPFAVGKVPDAQVYWEKLGAYLTQSGWLSKERADGWNERLADLWLQLQFSDPSAVLQQLFEADPIPFETLDQGREISRLFSNFYLRVPLWSLQGRTPLEVLEEMNPAPPKPNSPLGSYMRYGNFADEYKKLELRLDDLQHHQLTPQQDKQFSRQLDEATASVTQVDHMAHRLILLGADFISVFKPLVHHYTRDLIQHADAMLDATPSFRSEQKPNPRKQDQKPSTSRTSPGPSDDLEDLLNYINKILRKKK